MTPIETVQHALATIRGGDASAAKEVVSADFVWHIPGRSPISGDAHGIEGWIERLSTLLGAGLRPEVVAMLEGPEHVAAVQRNTAEVDGHVLNVRVVNLFTLADGKVQRLDTFFSDQSAAETFWTAALGT